MSELSPTFSGQSLPLAPQTEFLFGIRLHFTRVHSIPNTPAGFGRGAVYVDSGRVEGPRLNGKVLPDSGGDWAQFRPDGVLSFDARYMIEADDGALILLHNRGYLWGRSPDVMPRMRTWIFEGGPEVPFEQYYLRSFPHFETSVGKYDWLTRHVVVGVGERKADGNQISYHALL
jgi:hypothetical protein